MQIREGGEREREREREKEKKNETACTYSQHTHIRNMQNTTRGVLCPGMALAIDSGLQRGSDPGR